MLPPRLEGLNPEWAGADMNPKSRTTVDEGISARLPQEVRPPAYRQELNPECAEAGNGASWIAAAEDSVCGSAALCIPGAPRGAQSWCLGGSGLPPALVDEVVSMLGWPRVEH